MVVVGSINVDQMVVVDRRPGAGETVGNATLETHGGGKGANQAVAAARCGAGVVMVGRVGADAFGVAQRDDLLIERIDARHVLVTEGVTTGVAFVLLTPDGESSIVVVPGANGRLTPTDVDTATPEIRAADVLLAQLEVPIEAVSSAVDRAGRDTTVVLNWSPARAPVDAPLRRCDVLVVNEHEATSLTGVQVDGPLQAIAAGEAVLRLGPHAAVVTLGALGAVVVHGSGSAHVEAPRVQVVDTTGAGDAFVGALAARLARGSGLLAAVEYGVSVGSATTEQRGARTVPTDAPS